MWIRALNKAALLLVASLLILLRPVDVVTSVNAQSDFREITGFYTNSDASLEVIFPPGWSGLEGRSDFGSVALVSPKGYKTGQEQISPYLTVDIINKTAMSSLEPRFGPDARETFPCESSLDQVTLSGMHAIELLVPKCNMNGTSFRSVQYAFQTEQKFIIITFRGSPSTDYDAHLSEFENALKTLKIANTIDPPVVPEFPFTGLMLPALAILIGIAAIVIRKKLE